MIDIIITEPPHTCVYDSSNVVAPTCSSKSYTKYTCTVCSYSYNADETAKLEHNYSSWNNIISPTCSKESKKQRICSSCNNTETRNLEKTNHKEIAGKTQNVHSKCSVCNETISTEHAFDLIVENDSTAAIYKYTCDCGYQYTKVIPVSVCEHIDEDMNDLCDLCNENMSQETTIYYKDCEDCNGTGYEGFIKNVRPIYLVRKSIIYNFTYIFQKAKLIFLNAHAKTVINNF